jgi:hypothetical protein
MTCKRATIESWGCGGTHLRKLTAEKGLEQKSYGRIVGVFCEGAVKESLAVDAPTPTAIA